MSQNTNMTTAIKMTAAMPSFMHRAKYMNMNLKISLNDGSFISEPPLFLVVLMRFVFDLLHPDRIRPFEVVVLDVPHFMPERFSLRLIGKPCVDNDDIIICRSLAHKSVYAGVHVHCMNINVRKVAILDFSLFQVQNCPSSVPRTS